MIRRTVIALGVLFILVGLVLMTGYMVKQAINDSEFQRIHSTGKFSHPEMIVWTEWKPNDGTVNPETFAHDYIPAGKSEFRKGKVSGDLFDFTIYEWRLTNEVPTKIMPALGPGWGATYHGIYAFGALAIGFCLVMLSLVPRFLSPNPALIRSSP